MMILRRSVRLGIHLNHHCHNHSFFFFFFEKKPQSLIEHPFMHFSSGATVCSNQTNISYTFQCRNLLDILVVAYSWVTRLCSKVIIPDFVDIFVGK